MSKTLAALTARLATEGTLARPEAAPDGGRIMSSFVEGIGRLHLIITAEEQAAINAEFDAEKADRAARFPDEKSAINGMFDAFDRLRELGWREAIYCPKDGTEFQAIEAGSTGIHRCHYQGEWPTGSWWVAADGDLWPSHPILFRLYPDDEAKEKARKEAAIARWRAEQEAQSPSPPSSGETGSTEGDAA